MSRKSLVIFALIFAFAVTLGSAQALATRGGKKATPAATTTTSSLVLVLIDSRDGAAHWGQHITFDVTSSARYSFVRVDCYQATVWVYEQSTGFYVGWPLDQRTFTLRSSVWTGGAADCTALLYSTDADGSNFQSLATTGFHVAP